MKKFFVFTGGGITPALNPTIYGVVTAARERGWQILGGLHGWASLLPEGKHLSFDGLDITPLRENGGTILRSSRTNPLAKPESIEHIKKTIKELGIDGIVAIGGDDTLGASRKLAEMGLPIIGVPKTIDNDLSGTYFTPGFPSAAHYMSNFTAEIREDAAYALSRIFVIEAMGMKAGWVAASSCYGHADVIIPPEWEVSLEKTIALTHERYKKNGGFAVVVVAQEAKFDEPLAAIEDKQAGEQYGHARKGYICLSLKEKIKNALNIDTKALYPGNFLETGKPIPLDRDLAIALGQKAVDLLDQNQFGYMPRITNNSGELIVDTVSLADVVGEKKYRILPTDYFDTNNLLPTKKFHEYMEPILGVHQPRDDAYTKLINKVVSQSGGAD